MRALQSIDQMMQVMEAAVDVGINHIETSPPTDQQKFSSERCCSEAAVNPTQAADHKQIAARLCFAEGQRQLDRILERLGCQKLDNLAVHGINQQDHLDWALSGDGAALLDWAVSTGRVHQIGFSSHGSCDLIEQALQSEQFNSAACISTCWIHCDCHWPNGL